MAGHHLGDVCKVARRLWVSRESQGLETRMMPGPCFKQCSSTAPGNAHALPQAMPQARILLAVYGWCARPMASMSRCAAAAAEFGAVTSPVLDSKYVAGLGPAGGKGW